jgi:hypothetical protein
MNQYPFKGPDGRSIDSRHIGQIIGKGRCPTHFTPIKVVYDVYELADGSFKFDSSDQYGEGDKHKECVERMSRFKREYKAWAENGYKNELPLDK